LRVTGKTNAALAADCQTREDWFMKVMFIPWGQATHYFFMVPLVWAFRAAGDEVRVASQPGAAEAIKRSGMSVTVVGEAYDFRSEEEMAADGHRGMAAIRERSSATDD